MKKYIKPMCKVAQVKIMMMASQSFSPGEKNGDWEAESKSTYNTLWTDSWEN